MRRLAAAAMLAGLAFVLSSFVYLPNMAPFQHFVNVLAAALVGPWYALGAALVTGLLRRAARRPIHRRRGGGGLPGGVRRAGG